MNEEVYVPAAIKKAQPGSLLYSLTEKIAYGLYERNPQEDKNVNWFKAQRYFEKWLTRRFGEAIYPLSALLEQMLELGEKSYKRDGVVVSDIRYAFATMIIEINESGRPIIPLI